MELRFEKIKEHEDGSATYLFEAGKKLKNFIKQGYNRKRYSDKLGEKYIRELLNNMMKKDRIK